MNISIKMYLSEFLPLHFAKVLILKYILISIININNIMINKDVLTSLYIFIDFVVLI